MRRTGTETLEMSDFSPHFTDLPPEQEAIRAKCFHPTGTFVEFKKEEIEQSIPERFEQQVARYPDRIAVKSRNHTLTYDVLNKMANRVARAILAQREERQEVIALLLENDAPMAAAILGVLKTCNIYLAMDSSLPELMAAQILEDSHARVIVTNNRNLLRTEKIAKNALHVVNIDEIDPALSAVDLRLSILPESLSRIRYTSGSAGKPKGVVQNHRNLLHHSMSNTNSLHICSDDRINAGSQDLFNALLNGASHYLLDIQKEGLVQLASWLIQNEITIHRSVSTAFRHFLDILTGQETFPHLRLIELGGEAVLKMNVELYKKHFSPSCILVNRLGNRETGGVLRQFFVDKRTQVTEEIIPVGYAVGDKEVLLLGEDGKQREFNQIGEIVVKSRYLSLGYWGKPELTDAVFLPDPKGEGERFYHTGDLGLMLSDGCLLHLGRKDFQVKIRGNRVDPAEVERALLVLEAVKEVVVVADEDPSRNKRLVAYVVPNKQPAPTVSALRQAIVKNVATYMVPSAFVILDALPLTADGKVDLRALPAPIRARSELESAFVPPRTPVEEALAAIWTEVLGIDQTGIHDNFFDLGGSSLLATRIVSRVINRFRVQLPVQSLFDASTVADMAAVITRNQAEKLGEKDLERMLTDLELLTEEEAQRLLSSEIETRDGKN